MKERIIENGIEYELRGDIYYPILTLGEQTSYEIIYREAPQRSI